jgi:hypothetical protein
MEIAPSPERTPDVWTRPLEIMALMLGFVLLLAAEWFPWFQAYVPPRVSPENLPLLVQHGYIGLTDAAGDLRVLYFVGMAAVLTMCAVTAFGSPTVRRLGAPIAIGVLAGQALIVFAILHTRGLPTAQALNLPSGVTVSRASGAYAVIVALVFFAATIVPALMAYGRMPTAQSLQESMARLSGRVPFDAGTRDEDLRRPSEFDADDRYEPLNHDRVEVDPVDGRIPVEAPLYADHSAYRRPQIIASDAAYRR